MSHEEFVEKYAARKILVLVNREKGLVLANSNILPKRYQAAHIFWSWVWFLSIPVSIALFFVFIPLGLIATIFSFLLRSCTVDAALQFVIDYAIEDPSFYEKVKKDGVIQISQV